MPQASPALRSFPTATQQRALAAPAAAFWIPPSRTLSPTRRELPAAFRPEKSALVSSPFAPLRAHGLGLCFGAQKQEVGEAGELRGGVHGAPLRRRSRPAGPPPAFPPGWIVTAGCWINGRKQRIPLRWKSF